MSIRIVGPFPRSHQSFQVRPCQVGVIHEPLQLRLRPEDRRVENMSKGSLLQCVLKPSPFWGINTSHTSRCFCDPRWSHVANCENCRKSRTKCWFFYIHVSCLESPVFLWRRRVYGGSWKTCPFQMFPSRLSCCFAWQTWHFLTFPPV